MASWTDVPNECECGSNEFEYTITKEVRILVDEDEPYIGGVAEGFTNVICAQCHRVHIEEDEVADGDDIDEMMNA